MNIIIFGASGDLAKRKLFPALAKIPLKNTKIIGFARTKYDKPFSEVLKSFYTYENEFFCELVQYIQGKSYTDLEPLKHYFTPETIVYLSLPPEVYLDTLRVLSNYEFKGIAVEKPFGSNYDEFLEFYNFPTEKFFFIDHFLLKPLIVSWPNLISTNKQFEMILDKKHIKSVKIIFKEEIGAEGRAYFDTHGLVKDVVQNHLSELLAVLITEHHPDTCDKLAEGRVSCFKNTKIIEHLSCFGQYNEYTHEMNKPSSTETFSIITLNVDFERWENVPFITIAGKGMNEKKTEIIFEIKTEAYREVLNICKDTNFEHTMIHNMRIICNLAPKNEVFLEFICDQKTVKHVIFTKSDILKYMHEKYGEYENHEIVFNSFIQGTSFNVVRFSEAELMWKIYSGILKKEKKLFYYSKGSDIPKEADLLLKEIDDKY